MGVDAKTGAEKSRGRVGRLVRLGLGTPEFELREVWKLSELIRARLDGLDQTASVRHSEWVASRFRYPLRALLIVANRDATTHVGVTLTIVAGGFATSGIAVAAGAEKGSTASWIVFGIGLLMALAAAASQQLRFGIRSNERRALAVALREEGWHFANCTGEYAGNNYAVFVRFEQKVDEIHRRIGQIDLLGDMSQGSDNAQPGSQGEASGDSPTSGARTPGDG